MRDAGPGKDDGKWPYYQMERLDIYNRYVQDLLSSWQAYYAWESSEELTAMRDLAHKQKKAFNYRKPDYTDDQIARYKAEWRVPVVRFAVPYWQSAKEIVFEDMIKGETRFNTNDIGDFVIVKSDGVPTFYLANAVDDALHEITHVIRGEDHLSNVPKQVLLYEAMWFDVPVFGHLPLMLNPSGKKMSKRDTDIWLTLVHQFREEWFLPEAVLNFIALIGWNPWTEQEIFSRDELIESFSMERVQKSNAVYDFKRGLWFNAEHIKRLSDEEFTTRVQDFLQLYGGERWMEIIEVSDLTYRHKFAEHIKVRIQTFGQFKEHCYYFFERPVVNDTITEMVNNPKMKVTPELTKSRLPWLMHLLEHLSDEQWDLETIKEELFAFIKAHELKNGQVLWPVRCMLTGVQASPWAFEMLDVLGKEESLLRLEEYKRLIETII